MAKEKEEVVLAKQDFEVYVDKKTGALTSYKDGDPAEHLKKVKVERGKPVPSEILPDIYLFNKAFLQIKYENTNPVVPAALEKLKTPPLVKKRKWNRENLNELAKEKGFKEFRKFAKEKFGEEVTGRSVQGIITDILAEQERRRRTG